MYSEGMYTWRWQKKDFSFSGTESESEESKISQEDFERVEVEETDPEQRSFTEGNSLEPYASH